MNLLAEFIKYLYEHIGDAYVWGAQGQKLSGMTEQNLIKWVRGHETSTVNADRALRFIANSTKNPLYAFDCSGLIMYFFQNFSSHNHMIFHDGTLFICKCAFSNL